MNPRTLRASWVRAAWPAPDEVHALTTARAAAGHAAFDVGDSAAAASRALLRDATVGPAGRLQWLKQVHGRRCIRATQESCAGAPEADAAWTEQANLGLVIKTADCVPVVLADRNGERIGAAHAGWRGLAGGILERLAEAMGGGASLIAWIGPAIGPASYEVGPDVHAALADAFGAALCAAVCAPGARPGKWQLDLHALAKHRLRAAGLKQLHGERLCTYSDRRFHSHRRDGPAAGRMATVIWKSSELTVPPRR